MSRLHSALSSWRDYLAPINKTSTFKQNGQITPDEFVAAGDYLCYRFPTWSWASGTPARKKPHLPPNKQYLITRHVPVNPLANRDMVLTVTDDSGWVETTSINPSSEKPEPDVIPDMEDLTIEEDEDQTVSTNEPSRTYTLYITYSPYYRTPRMYLQGYSPSGSPLPPNQMLGDIGGEYAEKTVTVEEFPWLEGGVVMASVHPCMHANVMKQLVERAEARYERKAKPQDTEGWDAISTEEFNGVRVDQYLIIFLKFMASVMPSVEYDFTMAM